MGKPSFTRLKDPNRIQATTTSRITTMPASARANVLVDATRLSAWITVVRAERLLEVDHPVSVPVVDVMNVGRLSHPVGRTRAANAQHAVRRANSRGFQDGGYRLRG